MQKPASFHKQMVEDWYKPDPFIAHAVFRGGAKSTIGEESVAIIAALGVVKNVILVGANEDRAKERLQAIVHEYETNELLRAVFGALEGQVWGATKIILRNSTAIQALGWNQSIRGIKHFEWRPDFCWIDDPEDDENVKDDESRAKLVKRLLSTIIPAIDAPGARIRVTGSILDAQSLIPKLHDLPRWKVRVHPVRTVNAEGDIISAWSERKSLTDIAALEEDYKKLGQHDVFQKEYMCDASAPQELAFRREYFRSVHITRRYEPTYAIYDPARTTNQKTSAHTGKIVYSWYKNRLLVWESGGYFWAPDTIIDDMFITNAKYKPIFIGVEQDGLHEFLFQPIRQQQVRTGTILPVVPLKAPKGKISFIRALQPFFKAGEIVFVPDEQTHETLISQLLAFPTGRIDIPNAFAYALTPALRTGVPVFENFDQEIHIDPSITPSAGFPCTLAANTADGMTSAVLVQHVRGRLTVLADWISEGDAGACLTDFVHYARALVPGIRLNVTMPPETLNRTDTSGVRAAAMRLNIPVSTGGSVLSGQEELRRLMRLLAHGLSGVAVHPDATWTVRALGAGYAWDIKPGHPARSPRPGAYKVLAEGLLSAVACTSVQEAVDNEDFYAYTKTGQKYLSSRR